MQKVAYISLPYTGLGLDHLPLDVTSRYSLDGWWDLRVSSDAVKPLSSRRRVTLRGHVALTRVSECRLKVVLENAFFSDWKSHPRPKSRRGSWCPAEKCGRSVVSAVLNVATTSWDFRDALLLETDHLGRCETQYHLEHLAPTHYTISRTRDLSTCQPSAQTAVRRDISVFPRLTDTAVWGCRHTFLGSVPTHAAAAARASCTTYRATRT
ncbi:hypothetical protein C7M84_007696 [Penaeus vannamei]|uniref:Uncharacterized protein n=1 Tax=Penaeus vannamei TaxID=6689 RepID=A0A3R7P2R5_PENVA|nr:hypothetical protein C7M84_007696 [Penaeus vannamei]